MSALNLHAEAPCYWQEYNPLKAGEKRSWRQKEWKDVSILFFLDSEIIFRIGFYTG